MGGEERDSAQSFTMSLEAWLLERLVMLDEQLEDKDSDKMLEMFCGGLTIIETCLKDVKISSKHDEIAAAFKKVVLKLEKRSREHAAFSKEILGPLIFKKLEEERDHGTFDWSYAEKLRPDAPDGGEFLKAELERVWG